MSVKIVYTPVATPITLTLKRGPLNFKPYWDGRVHDNLATDGSQRERVTENLDILIAFEMPHLLLQDDMAAWAGFESFALAGGAFQFFPSDGLTEYYNCVLEDAKFQMTRNAPQKYGAPVVIRVLQDGQAPADPAQVLRRFYGIST